MKKAFSSIKNNLRKNKDQWLVIFTLILAIGGMLTAYESRRAAKATIQMAKEERKRTDIELTPVLVVECKIRMRTDPMLSNPQHVLLLGTAGEMDIEKNMPYSFANLQGGIFQLSPALEYCSLKNYGRLPALLIRLPIKNYPVSPGQNPDTVLKEVQETTGDTPSNTTYLEISGLAPGERYDFIIANGTTSYMWYNFTSEVFMESPLESMSAHRLLWRHDVMGPTLMYPAWISPITTTTFYDNHITNFGSGKMPPLEIYGIKK